MANSYFTCTLNTWVSGATIYANMTYSRSGAYTYSDSSFPTPTLTIDGTTYYDTDFANRVHSGVSIGSVTTTTFSKTVSANGEYDVSFTAGSGVRSDFAGTWTGKATVTGASTAPTGLSLSNIIRAKNGFTGTVSISGWGNGGSVSSRYLEMSVCTGQNTTTRRLKAVYTSALSATIAVDNDTTSGSFDIQPNTAYYLTMYATNGAKGTGNTTFSEYTTLAPQANVSLHDKTAETATFVYTTPADGGKYAKTVQYSLDDGNTWVDAATVATGAAASGNFTVSGLDAETSYTLRTRISTPAGVTNNVDVHFITEKNVTIYCSVNGRTKKVEKIYCSVNGAAKEVQKIYASVNGKTKRVF